MDSSITYATAESLPAAQREALRAFVARGSTRLCSLPADPAVDSFMASADFERIVHALESASARFRVAWELCLAGEPAGRIEDGRRSPEVDEAIQDLLQVCELRGVHPEDLDREAILADQRGRPAALRCLPSAPS